jgi:deoxyribodipyrimidine photo-lyase
MLKPLYSKSLCWFRRDLRLNDHAALSQALEQSEMVYCAFIFDTGILDALTNKQDRRVEFILGISTSTLIQSLDLIRRLN